MPVNDAKRDDVRKVIVSLLVARPGATAVTMLDNDYYEAEGERIPWQKFGYSSIVDFLQSMPQHFSIEWCYGCHYVRGFASEKSKHVSSLVSRQKNGPRIPSRIRHRFSHYAPSVQRPGIRIPAEQLNILAQYVRNYPNGISMQSALLMVQKQLPHVTLSAYDLQQQLRELAHQLYIDGEVIRPIYPLFPDGYNGNNARAYRESINYHSPSAPSVPPLLPSLMPSSLESPKNAAQPSAEVVYDVPEDTYEGKSDMTDFNNDGNDFVPADYVDHRPRRPETAERLEASFNRGQSFNYRDSNNDDDAEYSMDAGTTGYVEKNDVSALINDRMRMRLEQLIRKHPEGIWCRELPEVYLTEYKVPLNYIKLGFNSVREYAAYLPNIFYMTRHGSNDDFKLYSADKRPRDQEMSKSHSQETLEKYVQGTIPRTEPIEMAGSRELHDMDDDEAAPFPADISPSICAKFAPDGVMSYDESVGQILVTDLQCTKKQYLEVYIVEIFTPSFFWIQLRGNKRHLETFMDEMREFYEQHKDTYAIPKFGLKRGLNCACMYAGLWHRGIIKTVKPDYRVTVMFYDYGTLKTYSPEDIYYLHKQFSYLPAQAIPCGLYNVKPCVSDRWKKSITDRFVDRISDRLLAATVVSVNPPDNSMLIVLTDTSEEEDVHINDWLVRENLARCGKMVRMLAYRNFIFQHNMSCNRVLSHSTKTSEVVTGVDEAKCDRDRSMPPRDEKARKLSNVESESTEKNVEASRKVPIGKKVIVQMLRDIYSTTETPADAKTQSSDCTANEKPKGPKELVMLLEKLKASSVASSGASVSSPKTDNDFQDNARQIDAKVDVKPKIGNKLFEYDGLERALYTKFTMRDSDNEENNNEKDFGTFQSFYGGHGIMDPFDWSMCRGNDSLAIMSSDSNVEPDSVQKNNNDTKERYFKSDKIVHNQDKLTAKQCFLNLTRKEKEYFLANTNIDYDVKDVSQSVAKLRNRMEIHNDKYTTMIVKRETIEMLRGNVQSQDTPNSGGNIVESDGAISLKGVTRQEVVNEINVDKSDEVCETSIDRDTREEKRDSNADLGLVSSNTNDDKDESGSTTECNAESPGKTDKALKSRFKMLLEQMKRVETMDSSSGSSGARESSNSERIQSSYSSIRSRSSTDDTMISSDDEQNEAFSRKSVMARFNKLCGFARKPASSSSLTSSSDVKLESDSETRSLPSPEDSSANALSINVADSERQRPNAATSDTRTSRILREVLKMQQNMEQSELDSDDLSNRDSCDNEKEESGEPPDRDASVTCDSTNNDNDANIPSDETVAPVFEDRDLGSADESEWDFAMPEHFLPSAGGRITEISERNESESV